MFDNSNNSNKATIQSIQNLNFLNEKWTIIRIDGIQKPPHYEVSSFGRLKSFQTDPAGILLNGSVIQGYKSLNIKLSNKKAFIKYIHKLVAENYVLKPTEDHKYVIHLDFDKQSNRFDNLKWVTKDEMVAHNKLNPSVINKIIPLRTSNYKLTESKVIMIKKMLKNDKNRIKIIAKQFGITATQVNRIKSGENWSRIKID